MKRNRWMLGALSVVALTLSACSDSGAKTVSSDDFVDQMEDICRDAESELGDLDPTDGGFVGDILDVIDTSLEDFAELEPPEEAVDDFDDFVANLEDQRSEFEDLEAALEDGDFEAAAEVGENLSELSADADELAESIGADRCIGIGAGLAAGGTTDVSVPDVSVPDVSVPDVSVPDVSVPDETTPNTPLPIDTTPPPTSPPATAATTAPPTEMTEPPMNPDATGEAVDASQVWAPPAGYAWGVLESLPGILTPSVDPTISPILVEYSAGIVHSTTGGPSAVFFITEVNSSPWSQEQLEALYVFLFGDNTPTDATTTLGLPAVVVQLEELTGAMSWVDGASIAVLAPGGTDVLALIDGFFTANSMQG